MKVVTELFLLSSVLSIVKCQLGFDSSSDKQYLARSQELLSNEVANNKENSVKHIQALQVATRDYISVKLKENVLKTVQALTADVKEQAVRKRSWKKSLLLREPRQDDEAIPEGASEGGGAEVVGGDGGSEDEEDEATTELTGLGTAVQINENVFKFLGDAVRIIVGGIGGGARPRHAKQSDDNYLVAAETLMHEPFSDQLLGLIVLIANESESQQEKLSWKNVRDGPFSLKKVLFNSVTQSQPIPESVQLKGNGLNSYYFVETFRQNIDRILQKRVLEQTERVPDLYKGVRPSFELLKAMEKAAARFRHD